MQRMIALVAVFGLVTVGAMSARAEGVTPPTLGEDGLYHHAWFHESFLDLAEDLDESHGNGKRVVLMFEQAGCIYCKKVNTEILTDPEVNKFVRENYNVIQINLWGDREVTDLDGEALPEKELARKWAVMFTPTIVFLPETAEQAAGRNGKQAAVAVMPGAFAKGTFLDLFTWVKEKGYETDEPFQKYHIRQIEKRRAAASN